MFNKWVLLIFNIEVPEQINWKTLMALSKPIISRIIKKESWFRNGAVQGKLANKLLYEKFLFMKYLYLSRYLYIVTNFVNAFKPTGKSVICHQYTIYIYYLSKLGLLLFVVKREIKKEIACGKDYSIDNVNSFEQRIRSDFFYTISYK